MPPIDLPPLPLDDWRATRTTLHGYVQVVGAVRAALSARQKHSSHRSLRVAGDGLTTTAIPYGSLTFEMRLDLTRHQLVIATSQGGRWAQRLRGQPLAEFRAAVLGALAQLGVAAEIDLSAFDGAEPGPYDPAAVERFFLAVSQVDGVLKRLRGEQRGETGDVQFWPHGMDLAMLWFSGRLVPGKDPNVPRDADEQMNFGFSTGDSTLPEPYFYATAYPLPPDLPATPWPPGVEWHNKGWQGAVLRYGQLVGAADADERLLNYWRAFLQAGARLMRG